MRRSWIFPMCLNTDKAMLPSLAFGGFLVYSCWVGTHVHFRSIRKYSRKMEYFDELRSTLKPNFLLPHSLNYNICTMPSLHAPAENEKKKNQTPIARRFFYGTKERLSLKLPKHEN